MGRPSVLLLSCAGTGVTAILAGVAQDLNQLIAARAIQGLGVGAEVPIAGAMFNEFARSKHRGGLVFAYQLMLTRGGVVAPWLALLLIALFGADGVCVESSVARVRLGGCLLVLLAGVLIFAAGC